MHGNAILSKYTLTDCRVVEHRCAPEAPLTLGTPLGTLMVQWKRRIICWSSPLPT